MVFLKKFWYLFWFFLFLVVLWSGYVFLEHSTSQNAKLMLFFIGCVILARLVITPIITIIIRHHDCLKEQTEQERKNDEKSN